MPDKVTPGQHEPSARGVRAAENSGSARLRPSEDGLRVLDGDAAMRATRAAQTLLASARHELRSPLQALLGFAELLDSGSYGALTAPQHAFLGHMRTAGKDLTATIDICTQILVAITTPAPPSSETCSLHDALEELVRTAEEPSPIRTSLTTSIDTAIDVHASKAALTQSFSLAINALTAHAKAQISVHIEYETAFVQLDFASDRADPSDQELHDIDDLLAEGTPSRSVLLLKLAALLLEPFGGSVACSAASRHVRIGLSRT